MGFRKSAGSMDEWFRVKAEELRRKYDIAPDTQVDTRDLRRVFDGEGISAPVLRYDNHYMLYLGDDEVYDPLYGIRMLDERELGLASDGAGIQGTVLLFGRYVDALLEKSSQLPAEDRKALAEVYKYSEGDEGGAVFDAICTSKHFFDTFIASSMPPLKPNGRGRRIFNEVRQSNPTDCGLYAVLMAGVLQGAYSGKSQDLFTVRH